MKLDAILCECCGLDSLHFVNYYVLSNLHTLMSFISTNCECTRFWQMQCCTSTMTVSYNMIFPQIYCAWTPLPKSLEIASMLITLCFTILQRSLYWDLRENPRFSCNAGQWARDSASCCFHKSSQWGCVKQSHPDERGCGAVQMKPSLDFKGLLQGSHTWQVTSTLSYENRYELRLGEQSLDIHT